MNKLLFTALLALGALAFAHAQVRPVPAFHAIKVASGVELTLTAGHAQRVAVEVTPAEFAQYLTTTVVDGTLLIGYANPHDPNGRERSRQHVRLRVAVTADELTALTASSGAAVQTSGDFDAADFRLDVSSGASVAAGMATTALSVRQSSGSTVALSGQAGSLDVQVSSGATFSSKNLQAGRCRAEASSGSSVQVAVKDDLVAQASSGGSISYSGSPQLTKHTSSGGSVSGR